MKIILLTAGGRAGAEFFHSLIDGHSQILQFPGSLIVDKKFLQIFNSNTSEQIARSFIKFFPEFFNSRIGKLERWDKLGAKKNKSFKVDGVKFINNFLKISKQNKNSSSLKVLINLHYAYYLARNKKINKIKILFINVHLFSSTNNFINFFDLKKFYIIHTMRHPLSSLSAPLRSWANYNNGRDFFPKDLYYQFCKVVHHIYDYTKLGKVYVLQLERLHTKNIEVMKNFCKIFGVSYQSCFTQSTKNGLKWWGDALTKKYISGINKKFKVNIYDKYFYKRDLIFFQNLTQDIINKYKYEFYYVKKNIYFNLLPMKCEILTWKSTFKNIFYRGFRWKHVLSIPFFYILRIFFINKIMINSKKQNLPRTL
jgi:hypothetical protein